MREFTFYKESALHHLRFNSNFSSRTLLVNKKLIIFVDITKYKRRMNQQFLKEIEMGSKNALVKRGSLHIIYIMVVPLFPIFQKN